MKTIGALDYLTDTLNADASSLWEVAGVTYSNRTLPGFEFPSPDTISLGATTTDFKVTFSDPGDHGRIFVGQTFVAPEPSSTTLLGLGFLGLLAHRNRA